MKRICLALLIGVAGISSAAAGDLITGKWAGPVTQVGSETGYWVNLTLTAEGGESFYPELNCGGTLSRVAEKNGYVFYTETITKNREGCMDGTVTIARIKAGLGWSWFGAQGPNIYVAYSSLAAAN